uniref:tRNA synthetases class I catalytic domain-containing protein n=1 Tax=Salix viminalis TaxID=40686 RepID=A0A6N2N549_SALVM
MTQQKVVFKPQVPGEVSIHLRHARAAVAFDIVLRYLQHLGYEVTCVRNFTDIDDKRTKGV